MRRLSNIVTVDFEACAEWFKRVINIDTLVTRKCSNFLAGVITVHLLWSEFLGKILFTD